MERKRDSVETFQKRLRDEVAAVENEINACNRQIEALNKRLEGLKRARELFDEEPAAVTELLRTSTQAEDGARNIQEPASEAAVKASARKSQPRSASRKLDAAPARAKPDRSLSAREQKAAQAHLAQVRDASRNDKVKRTDLIAAVLRTAPQTTLQESHQGSQSRIRLEVQREQSHRPFVYQPENVHSYRG